MIHAQRPPQRPSFEESIEDPFNPFNPDERNIPQSPIYIKYEESSIPVSWIAPLVILLAVIGGGLLVILILFLFNRERFNNIFTGPRPESEDEADEMSEPKQQKSSLRQGKKRGKKHTEGSIDQNKQNKDEEQT
ncbi:hypothetical protein RF11_09701 [Thelohanellus kitauei]|uniref:Uncharacterized protein n=1 Tax=Thelohanellus kitauei TaxID=669202 RepID=A0A0C2JM27_THEKT|nr:hypothetical protein RF11_09701 [Thelohanellus kitauei]